MQTLRITQLHQVVRVVNGRRQIIVLQPGDRIDGVRETKAGPVPVTEVSDLRRRLTAEEYAGLVKAGIIEEPDEPRKRGKKADEEV